MFLAWEQDIYAIMANLIDNSIFWLTNKEISKKEIDVVVVYEKSLQYIDYRDTGPGIEEHHIETEVVFEPDFSTKPEGTGLGLAIAGEAAARNGLELKAFASNTGAYFRLQPKEEIMNSLPSFNLLLVEDNEKEIKIFQDTLERYIAEQGRPVDVTITTNSEDALMQLSNTFDGAIVDQVKKATVMVAIKFWALLQVNFEFPSLYILQPLPMF